MKYPQPTPEELAEPKQIWLSVNRFWWEILQGQLEHLPNPDLWEDYTAEIDLAIHQMMIESVPTVAFVGGKAYRTNAQSIPSGVITKISLDTLVYGQGIQLTGGGLTVAEAGIYTVTGQLGFATGSNFRGVEIAINNTAVARHYVGASGLTTGGNTNYLPISWEGELALNDSVTIHALQLSGVGVNLIADSASSWLALHKLP